jgi:hypothetical protein
MFKLYSQSTQQIKPYPRNDDEPIIGLDADYLVLTQVDTAPPEYDDTTHTINSIYVVNTDTLEYIQEWIVTEKTISIPPDWDMFNLQMMSDARFNQVYNQCLSVAPIVCSALPVALDQITSKGNTLFTLIWNQLCSIGGATPEDREAWAELGINNNLPDDFVNVLRG